MVDKGDEKPGDGGLKLSEIKVVAQTDTAESIAVSSSEARSLVKRFDFLERKLQGLEREAGKVKTQSYIGLTVVAVAFLAFVALFFTVSYDYFQERRSEVQSYYSTLLELKTGQANYNNQ